MSAGIRHVSFGRPAQTAAWFALYDDGSQAWSGFPTSLHNKLNGRKKSLPGVEYLALSDSRSCSWFVRFEDKTYRWDTENEKLDRWLREDTVSQVIFGPGDGYFVIFEDGSTAWDGLPRSLHNKLIGRQKSLPPVKSLAISGSGGWFVMFEDGQFSWMGLPKFLNDALRQNGEVKFVTLSPDDNQSYFVEFEDGFQEWSYTEEFAREIKGENAAKERNGRETEEGSSEDGMVAGERWGGPPPMLRKPRPSIGSDRCDSPPPLLPHLRSPIQPRDSRPLTSVRPVPVLPPPTMPSISKEASPSGVGVGVGVGEGEAGEEERELEIDPRDIRYTQEVISSRFRNGRSLYDAVRDLQYGYLAPQDFPPIRVVTSRKGNYWSLDNRRLWVFKQARVPRIPAIVVDQPEYFGDRCRGRNGWTCTVR